MPRQRWTNWIGDQTCECDVITPTSRDQLQEMVKSKAANGRIRASGNRYSWSPLVPNKDTIICMDRLNQELRVDRKERTVEVECGMTVDQLTKVCAREGLSLISPTLFPRPQIGGAISTGAHGTGFGVKTFSDSVVEMTFVKHDGSLATVKRGDRDYDAAKVALGTFGIIYSVKLQTTPNFTVYTDKVLIPVDSVLEHFPDLLASCQYLEMFWFPFAKNFWVYLMDKTESKPDEKTWLGELRERFGTWVQKKGGGVITPLVAKHAPSLTPFINRIAVRFSDQVGATVQPASKAFHFQKAYPKAWDLSYAIPAQFSAQAWSDAIGLVERFGKQHLYPVNFALHCRFLGAGSTWLATDFGRETCVIEAATAKDTPHWDDFYRRLEECWFKIDGARPHWGKVYTTARRLKDRYPKMHDFLQRREAWDPNRVFLNDFLENDVFQLNGAQPARAGGHSQRVTPLAAAPGRSGDGGSFF